MAHKSPTLQEWIKQNSLPDELGDVFYEESISNMGALKCISMKKFDAICDGLDQKMGHSSFTKDVRAHLIQCVRKISPKIDIYLNLNMGNGNQQSQQPQQNRSVVSSQDNKVIDMLTNYSTAYQSSVQWLQLKQQLINEERQKFNDDMKNMFDAFINKINHQKKLYQSDVEQKFKHYKESLKQNYETQSKTFEKIKKAQSMYNNKRNSYNLNTIRNNANSQTDAMTMDQFNVMVANKMRKYDPAQCINNPDDLFQTLQRQQNEIKDIFTKKMEQILTVNPVSNIESDDNKSNNDDNKEDGVIGICKKCNKAISVLDIEDNIKDVGGALVHMSCYGVRLYTNKFVSTISQYSLDATGSCTINALEAALQLQMGRKPSVELVDEIVNLAALYKQDKHTAVGDIFPKVTRYRENLEKVDWMQITVNDIGNIINKMTKILQNESSTTNSVSAVLTKPPETIFMHYNFRIGVIYIYDSHPRPQLDGSHFLVFNERKSAEKYLQSMWPYQNLGAGFNDLRSQLINMLDVTLFQLKFGAKPSKKPNLELMGLELSKIGVSLEKKWQQTYGNSNRSNNDNLSNNQELQKDEMAALKLYNESLKEQVATLRDQMQAQKLQHGQNASVLPPPSQIKVAKSNPGYHERKHDDKKPNGNNYNNGNMYKEKSSNNYNNGNMYGRKDSLVDNPQMFKCKKCSKKKLKTESFIFTNCKEKCTKVCRNCTKDYFKKQFEVGKWPIKCPQCGKQECDAADFMLCDKEVAELYQEQYKLVLAGFNEVQCPKCGEVKMLKNWKTSNRSIKCPKWGCNFAACKKCYIGWDFHDKISCEDMKKLMTDSKHWRKCKCGKIVQNGTDKFYQNNYQSIVTCNKCRRGICYRCGETFNKDKYHSCPKQVKTWWQSIAEYINPMSYMT